MERKMIWLVAMTLILVFAHQVYVEACGVIIPERPPQVRKLDNMSVKNATLDIKIENQVAMVTVDEVFHNPNNMQLEGTFILPVMPGTVVQDLSMWMNGKETRGELLDRDQAWRFYGDVVRKMKDPALLEYAGTGLLKLRVFPIPARGDVRIKYAYTCQLTNDNGLCVFRHPWGTNKFSSQPLEQALIKVTLKSKIPLKNIYSPTYPNIDIVRKDDYHAVITFEQNNVKPDKDFILYYTLSQKDFGVNLVTYKKANQDGYFMMLISPKYVHSSTEVIKKDVVFVLDTSGSMVGEKIEQAKGALKFCVNALYETDRFNIVTFSTEARAFKKGLQEVTASTRAEALDWIKDIEARGGTNINDALLATLDMADPAAKRPYIIVFLTDGLPTVGEQDPAKILKSVAGKNTSATRIYTFGVGYDVNTHLLDKLAEANHGARSYIAPKENIEVKVSNFYDKIASPVLSDVKVDVGKIEIYDRYPKTLPDLFRGAQLVFFGRYKGEGHKLITLSGTVNAKPRKLQYEATFASVNEAPDFIPRLWATTKIGYLMDEIRLHGERKELKEEIVALAKEHGILTPYTSWLVLEDTIRRPPPPGLAPLRSRLEKERGVMTASRDMAEALGAGAVRQSRLADDLKKGQFYEMAGISDLVTQVADKTFYLGKDSIWYDSQYKDKDKDKVTKVKYLSDEYFDLIKKHPKLGKYLAIGEKVVVCFGGKIYEVTKE